MVKVLTGHCALNGHVLITGKRGLSDGNRCGLEKTAEYYTPFREGYSEVSHDVLDADKLQDICFGLYVC